MSGMVFWTSVPLGMHVEKTGHRNRIRGIRLRGSLSRGMAFLRPPYTGSSPKTILYAGRQGRIAILEITRLHFCWQAHCLCLKILG